jgi:hypothetical protein
MKPGFMNLFMNRPTLGRVVPRICFRRAGTIPARHRSLRTNPSRNCSAGRLAGPVVVKRDKPLGAARRHPFLEKRSNPMSFITRPLAMRAPMARAFSLSMLLGATLLGSTFLASPLLAQTASPAPAVTDAAAVKAETVEQRIATLHDKLKITSGQETSWTGVARTMRDNSAAMEKLVAAKKAQMGDKMTAVDDLATYQAFAQAHVEGLQKLSSAFSTLYNAMPADQKLVADEVFRDFGRGNAAKHG